MSATTIAGRRRARHFALAGCFIAAGTAWLLWQTLSKRPADAETLPIPSSASTASDGEPINGDNQATPSRLNIATDPSVASSDYGIDLQFRDEGSNAVPGVSLFHDHDRRDWEWTAADSRGVARVTVGNRGVSCWTRAEGFADQQLTISSEDAPNRTVILERENLISGVVLSARRSPIGNIKVIAWPRGSVAFAGQTAAFRALSGDPRCAVSESRHDGTFTIRGLSAGVKYCLAAGGGGRTTEVRSSIAVCPSSNVELVVHDLYGALVTSVDESGMLVGPDHRLSPFAELGISFSPKGNSAIMLPVPGVALAGLPSSQFHPPSGALLCLCTADDEEAEVLVSCRVDVPGYELVDDIDIALSRLEDPIRVHQIVLRKSTEQMGTLVMMFSPQGPGATVSDCPRGTLTLKSTARDTLIFDIPEGKESAHVLEVPRGDYMCRFNAIGGSFAHPPHESSPALVAVSEIPVTFFVPIQGTGSVEFVLGPPRAMAWVHRVSCIIGAQATEDKLGRQSIAAGKSIGVEGPPFLIKGLPVGTYSIAITEPKPTQPFADLVNVENGSVARLNIRLR